MAERKDPRYEVHAYVDYTGTDVLLYHGIQNLSLGGMCLVTPSIEAVGTRVDIVITFPDLGKQLALHGEVVWANSDDPRDMGIRWLDLTEEDKALLRRYLEEVKTSQVGTAGPKPD